MGISKLQLTNREAIWMGYNKGVKPNCLWLWNVGQDFAPDLSLSPLATNRSLTYLDYECILIAYVHQTINPQPPWQTAHAMLQRPLFWSQVLYITPWWWPSQLAFQQLRVAPLPVSWWQARTFFRHFLSGLIKWHQWECLQLAAT